MTIFKLKLTLSSSTHTNNHILLPILPLEIREQIYSHVIFPEIPEICTTARHYITFSCADAIYGGDPRFPCFLHHNLYRVSEDTRIEVCLLFIRYTEIGLMYPQHTIYFAQFLCTFPGIEGFGAIRRLDFPLFSRHRPDSGRPNSYIELMQRCEGLTEVRVKFEIWYLLMKRLSLFPVNRLTPEELEQQAQQILDLDRLIVTYRLDGLLELPSLTRVTVEVWPRVTVATTSGLKTTMPNGWSVMKGLVEWIKRGFEERGRDAEVVLLEGGNSGLRWPGPEVVVRRPGMSSSTS
ncbi:hypothetical protein EK21DRAFT_64297 [Setomelanomma holmii]|uniref:Uncharacterized protein n=1 Tax=Setomelanomma holmii TaxID=210430 RepID=A0A9P4HD98_9PLEO|nr:hypothetical protein EK21DRAFT_64297 [Setomelanomma holmii]